MNRKSLLSLVAWIGFVFFTLPIGAVSVRPNYQIKVLRPGKKGKGTIDVINTDEIPLRFHPSTKDWFISDENKPFKGSAWLSVRKKPFVLDPGDSKKVAFKVRAPKGAKGELVGMVSFLMEKEIASTVNSRISVAVYLAISGTEELAGELTEWNLITMDQSLRTSVAVKNDGNVHLRPEGEMTITDKEDHIHARLRVPRGRPTYPGRSRGYFGDLKDFSLQPGEYKATLVLTDVDRGVPIADLEKSFHYAKEESIKLK